MAAAGTKGRGIVERMTGGGRSKKGEKWKVERRTNEYGGFSLLQLTFLSREGEIRSGRRTLCPTPEIPAPSHNDP